jgi:hypothetical protein
LCLGLLEITVLGGIFAPKRQKTIVGWTALNKD